MRKHPSAAKRHRQSITRHDRNQAIRSRVRTSVRHVREALATQNAAEAQEHLQHATRTIDKAVSKGVLHRNTASRKISRLTRALASADRPRLIGGRASPTTAAAPRRCRASAPSPRASPADRRCRSCSPDRSRRGGRARGGGRADDGRGARAETRAADRDGRRPRVARPPRYGRAPPAPRRRERSSSVAAIAPTIAIGAAPSSSASPSARVAPAPSRAAERVGDLEVAVLAAGRGERARRRRALIGRLSGTAAASLSSSLASSSRSRAGAVDEERARIRLEPVPALLGEGVGPLPHLAGARVIDRDALGELAAAREEPPAQVGRPCDDDERHLRRLPLERIGEPLVAALVERLGAAQDHQRPRPEQRRRLDRVRDGSRRRRRRDGSSDGDGCPPPRRAGGARRARARRDSRRTRRAAPRRAGRAAAAGRAQKSSMICWYTSRARLADDALDGLPAEALGELNVGEAAEILGIERGAAKLRRRGDDHGGDALVVARGTQPARLPHQLAGIAAAQRRDRGRASSGRSAPRPRG